MSNWDDVHVQPPQGGGLLDGLLVHQAAVPPAVPPPQPNGDDSRMQDVQNDDLLSYLQPAPVQQAPVQSAPVQQAQDRVLPQPLPVGPIGPPLGGSYLPGAGGAATGAAPSPSGYLGGVFSGKGGGFPSFSGQRQAGPGQAPQFFNIGDDQPPWRQGPAGQGCQDPSAQMEKHFLLAQDISTIVICQIKRCFVICWEP